MRKKPVRPSLTYSDESHRSIFKKYRAIFDYFDAILVGLTATPKTDVDHNTYDFFELEDNVPTYAYDYETAVYKDHVLVPYYNYQVKTEFLEKGITYAKLSQKDRERLEDAFTEDNREVPDFIPSGKLNKFIFNATTVDTVLQDLMERGIKVDGGEKLGKTIIFAQSKRHAQFIIERFEKLYPQLSSFAQRVVCDDAYVQTTIDDFRIPDKNPQIAVSVDMMDTGIDVPECVNLVFFKQVKSKTKFWQMIGRGTRLCPDLECVDQIDGEYVGKKRFLIFDYCGNFEFFETHKEGYEGKEARSLSEIIFDKKIELAMRLQTDAYADAAYQNWRTKITEDCCRQIKALNTDLVSVHTQIRYVEKYRNGQVFQNITEEMKGELKKKIAPLIHYAGNDESAKRFDNFMYGLMIQDMDGSEFFVHTKEKLVNICVLLRGKASIPQVNVQLPLIREVESEAFWEKNDLLEIEKARENLRGLIQFLVTRVGVNPIYVKLEDPVIERKEGNQLPPAYDFEDYKKKVNRYINEHGNSLPIYKLTHNIALTETDYKELERVLTVELGSREDYKKAFGDTPLGLMVRKVAKMDHEAAMEEFSDFINDQSLNSRQIAYVRKIVSYIEHNGYMENTDLMKPPFDKPTTFIKLFDPKRRTALMQRISKVKENAVTVKAG